MTLRTKTSRLEGHPTKELPFIDAATGSLGQGLAMGLGMALGTAELDPAPMVFVLMGDAELSEGSVWEALGSATQLNINNVCAIIDFNSMGQSGPSLYAGNLELLTRRLESFGWRTHTVDGHDTKALSVVLGLTIETEGPHAVICTTTKGKGVSIIENKEGWHGKVLSQTQMKQALDELGDPSFTKLNVKKPMRTGIVTKDKIPTDSLPPSFLATTATRQAFGMAMTDLAIQYPDILGLDGDVKNSTRLDLMRERTPRQLIELSIAESTMIGMASGLDSVGKRPLVSTFAAFLTRCFDQLRLSSISRSTFVVNGSHSGVSIGQDGASQMGLEDIALMRNLPGCTVLYPSDAYCAYLLTRDAFNQPGITYLRTTREPTPIIYNQTSKFPIGGSHLHGPSDQDKVTIVAAGITVFEALKAQSALREQGIMTRVIDLYSIRPIDRETLISSVKQTMGNLVIAEDHHPEGGIGEAVLSALANLPINVVHLAVSGVPHSATPEEQLATYGLDEHGIEQAAKQLLK